MIYELYSHTNSPTHRLLLLSLEDGIGIFEDISSPYHCRVRCPMTPDFVIPYVERSEVVRKAPVKNAEWAYNTLSYGDGGEECKWITEMNQGKKII